LPNAARAHCIDAIVEGRHADPFAVLGIHEADGGIVVRAFVPGAASVDVVARDGARSHRSRAGTTPDFSRGVIPRRTAYRLRAANQRDAWLVDDPYAYGPVLGPPDDWLIGEGTHAKLYDGLGAHAILHEGVEGVHFAVVGAEARTRFRRRRLQRLGWPPPRS
jgi:1,4-alpha-glucan branching enzyme